MEQPLRFAFACLRCFSCCIQLSSCYFCIAHVWQVSFNGYPFFILSVAECDQRLLACHVVALSRQSSHAYADTRRSPTCILPSTIIIYSSFPVHFVSFVFHSTSFLSPKSSLCPRLRFVCEDSLKFHFYFDRRPFLLQLLQTCVDSSLICTSTAVTLMLHGCGGSFRPTYVHHVTEFLVFNRTCWLL